MSVMTAESAAAEPESIAAEPESIAAPVLNPNEIAALMASIGPEEEAKALFATLPPMSQPKKVKKLSLQQMAANSPVRSPSFIKLHELLTEALQRQWLEPINDEAVMELQEMVSETYAKVLKPDGVKVYFVFDCKERGCMLISLDTPTAVALVDFMLGGAAKSVNSEINVLSRVEQRLCRRIGQAVAVVMTEIWQTGCDISFDLCLIETKPDRLEIAASSDPFASVRYALNLNESLSGEMAIHYPLTMLDPLLKSMRAAHDDDPRDKDEAWIADLRRATDKLPLTLRLELGHCQLTIRDFLNVSTGDILPMNMNEHDPATLWVESVPMFLAMPGHRNGILAAEIREPIQEKNHG